ncbi:MAG: histidine kinase [Luteitalea sp.]|nr:histidine kinase [Luteitalea sp.]
MLGVEGVREELERLIGEMINKGILYEDARREFERRFIQAALDHARGSIGRAAELTGLHRNTLRRKICEYELSTNSRRGKGQKVRGSRSKV